MEEVTQKIRQYNSYVVGAWFSLEIFGHGGCILIFKFPLEPRNIVYVFDNIEEFLQSNCLEILKNANFIKVGNK